LKGLYTGIIGKEPPKIHNLQFFLEKTGVELKEDMKEFIIKLNVVSVPTRYPSDLSKMSSDYNKAKTGEILKMTKEVEKCLRTK
jgi:HEPN domain-containing protein